MLGRRVRADLFAAPPRAAPRRQMATRRSATRPTTTTRASRRRHSPPILQKAHRRERSSRSPRRGERRIRLIEDYLRENPALAGFRARAGRGALQAGRALLGRVEGRSTSRRWARYQAAVSACHNDRSACPHVPHRPPTDRSDARAGDLPAAHRPSTRSFRKIDTVIYLYAFSLRDQGKPGRVDQVLPDHPRQVSALPLHRRRLDGDRRVPLLRAAELQDLARGLREGPQVPQVAALRPGAVQDRLVLLEAGRHHASRRCGSRTSSISAKKKAGRSEDAAEARRGASGRGARLSGRALHRRRHQERPRRLRVPGPDWRQAVLAQGPEAAGRHRLRSDPLRARRRGLSPAHRARSQRQRRPRLRRQDRRGVPAARRHQDRRRGDAQAGQRLRRPQRLGRRQQGSPEGRRARPHAWPRGSSATWPRRCTREAQQNEKATKVVDKDRYARAAEAYQLLPGQLPRRARRHRAALPARRHPLLQAGQVRGRRARVPGRRQDPAGRQVPQGRAPAGDGRLREGAQADRQQRLRRRQARDHRQRSPVRRGGRPLRHAVPQRQGDRHRHLQERAVLLRLRRLRRGGQTVRPDRRALPRRSQRRRRRRSHPAGARQGQGLREHRELGAPPQEDQGVRLARTSRSASTS